MSPLLLLLLRFCVAHTQTLVYCCLALASLPQSVAACCSLCDSWPHASLRGLTRPEYQSIHQTSSSCSSRDREGESGRVGQSQRERERGGGRTADIHQIYEHSLTYLMVGSDAGGACGVARTPCKIDTQPAECSILRDTNYRYVCVYPHLHIYPLGNPLPSQHYFNLTEL